MLRQIQTHADTKCIPIRVHGPKETREPHEALYSLIDVNEERGVKVLQLSYDTYREAHFTQAVLIRHRKDKHKEWKAVRRGAEVFVVFGEEDDKC